MQNKKNIFVVYSPGTGGNHVANMLSTDADYITRASFKDYLAHNENDAHVGKLKNFSQTNDNFSSRPYFGNIFCFHFGSFYWMYSKIQQFKNRQIIFISPPINKSSLAYLRYVNFSGNIAKNHYFLNEQKTLYTPEVFEKLFSETDFFTLAAEMIFDRPVAEFFDYAETEMNFRLDRAECHNMHTNWIQKIKDYVNNATIS